MNRQHHLHARITVLCYRAMIRIHAGNRGTILAGMAMIGVIMLMAANVSADTRPPVTLVRDGTTDAVLVCADDLSSNARQAVEDLRSYLKQTSGASINVEKASQAGRLEIHIGKTPYVQSLNLRPIETAGVNIDAFRILFPENDRIVLVGESDSGTEIAVYDFTERYLGVRWLFPGDLGTYVPKTPSIDIAVEDIQSVPDYFSRVIAQLAAGGRSVTPIWLRRQRQHWTIQGHHALNKIFAPDKYKDSHPEFFTRSAADGKTIVADAAGTNWQPMLEAEGIVDEAISNLTTYFNENPGRVSHSLGVNDNNNFGVPPNGINSVGDGDYSDYYFNFTNQVIEGVLQHHPDKWFGCLAYVGVTDPPKETGVHPRMIPYICIDRHRWVVPAYAEKDMQRTRNWHAAAPVLGYYDYIYGDDMYRIPRMYDQTTNEFLKFGYENGVRAFFGEYNGSPDWIEGPKLYVIMKTLWDVSADADALKEEWYRLAVGDKAAKPLASYYRLWEDYWVHRVPKTDWFESYADRVYFNFDYLGYLDELRPADLADARKLLLEVVKLAETPEQKARAEFLYDGFERYFKTVDYYLRLRGKTLKNDAPTLAADTFAPAAGQSADEPTKVPSPWGAWQNEPGDSPLYFDRRNGNGDSYSLATEPNGSATSICFYRTVPLDDLNALYHAGITVQCTGLNEDAQVGIQIDLQRADGKYLPRKYRSNTIVTGKRLADGQWIPLNLFVTPPTDEGQLKARIFLIVGYGTQGVVRFDDFRFSKVNQQDIQDRKQ